MPFAKYVTTGPGSQSVAPSVVNTYAPAFTLEEGTSVPTDATINQIVVRVTFGTSTVDTAAGIATILVRGAGAGASTQHSLSTPFEAWTAAEGPTRYSYNIPQSGLENGVTKNYWDNTNPHLTDWTVELNFGTLGATITVEIAAIDIIVTYNSLSFEPQFTSLTSLNDPTGLLTTNMETETGSTLEADMLARINRTSAQFNAAEYVLQNSNTATSQFIMNGIGNLPADFGGLTGFSLNPRGQMRNFVDDFFYVQGDWAWWDGAAYTGYQNQVHSLGGQFGNVVTQANGVTATDDSTNVQGGDRFIVRKIAPHGDHDGWLGVGQTSENIAGRPRFTDITSLADMNRFVFTFSGRQTGSNMANDGILFEWFRHGVTFYYDAVSTGPTGDLAVTEEVDIFAASGTVTSSTDVTLIPDALTITDGTLAIDAFISTTVDLIPDALTITDATMSVTAGVVLEPLVITLIPDSLQIIDNILGIPSTVTNTWTFAFDSNLLTTDGTFSTDPVITSDSTNVASTVITPFPAKPADFTSSSTITNISYTFSAVKSVEWSDDVSRYFWKLTDSAVLDGGTELFTGVDDTVNILSVIYIADDSTTGNLWFDGTERTDANIDGTTNINTPSNITPNLTASAWTNAIDSNSLYFWRDSNHPTLMGPDGHTVNFDRFTISITYESTSTPPTGTLAVTEDFPIDIFAASGQVLPVITGTLAATEPKPLTLQVDNKNDSGTPANDNFGIFVDISGNRVLVGANFEDDTNNDSGVAYLLDRDTGSIIHTFSNPNDFDTTTNDNFGSVVAIDGNYSVISATFEDDANGTDGGTVYVFDNTTGLPLHTLNNPNPFGTSQFDSFGISLGISGDYIIVGAPGEDETSQSSSGKSYIFSAVTGGLVFTLDNENAFDTAGFDAFGRSVGISGNYAIVGAPNEDELTNGSASGKAYVYETTIGDWTDTALLRTLDNANEFDTPANDQFGDHVAIDGTTAVVGATFEDSATGVNSGAAYAFNIITGGLLQTFTNPNPVFEQSGDQFGEFVSISGNYVLISSSYDNDPNARTGRAWLYDVNTGSLLRTINNPNPFGTSLNDYFGLTSAIDGEFLIVGAPLEDETGFNSSGKAYVYSVTEGGEDTFAAIGTVEDPTGPTGTLAVTEEVDIFAASGTVATPAGPTGTLAVTEEVDVFAATGTVTNPIVGNFVFVNITNNTHYVNLPEGYLGFYINIE